MRAILRESGNLPNLDYEFICWLIGLAISDFNILKVLAGMTSIYVLVILSFEIILKNSLGVISNEKNEFGLVNSSASNFSKMEQKY